MRVKRVETVFGERVEDGWVVVVHEYVGVDGREACGSVYFGDAQVVACCDACDITPATAAVVSIGAPVAIFIVIGGVSANSVPSRTVSGGVYPVTASESGVESELFKCASWSW